LPIATSSGLAVLRRLACCQLTPILFIGLGNVLVVYCPFEGCGLSVMSFVVLRAVKCSFRQGRLTIGRRISSCPTSSAEFLDIRRSEPRLHGTMIPPVGEDQISLWVEYDKGTPVDSRPRGDDRLVYYLPWMNRRPWTASLP